MAKHSRISPKAATNADGDASAASRPIRCSAQRTARKTVPENALVPVAPRHDGWTPDRQRAFLEALADTGCVEAAAKAVNMSRQSAWRLRRRSDARAFDAAWEAALERAMQQLLPVALDRALNGTLRQRWYHGEVIAEERVYHDGLLRHLLDRGGAMLGAARERQALRKDWDGSLDALEQGAPLLTEDRPQWQVWRDPHGVWLTDAPAPPGFRGYQGIWGHSDYFRHLTPEEKTAQEAREAREQAQTRAALTRFFAQ